MARSAFPRATRLSNLRIWKRVFSILGAVLIVVGIFGVVDAQAQDITQLLKNLTPEEQQKLQGIQQQSGQPTPAPQFQQPIILTPPGILPPQQTQQPAPQKIPQPVSRLEQIMSSRAGIIIRQFGYDQIGVGANVTIPQTGAIQENYVLGVGDEIDLTLRGQENSQFTAMVDRNGQVIFPRLNPIEAAGRTLGDFKRDLIAAVHRAYISTNAYVTVRQLRQVTVSVTGEVANPGVRVLTALSSPLDAILLSGGVKKSGSLRDVQIVRDGKIITIDLYAYLTGHGQVNSTLLSDGDRIVVPALGPTVAVVGWVRRPRIYELPAGQKSISVSSLLSLAGGLEVRGKYSLSILRVRPDGRTDMVPVTNNQGVLHDSDILFAQPAADQTVNQATLSGGMTLAGPFSLKNTKLSELLKQPGALGDNPYTLFGIISRKDPVTQIRSLIAFSPLAVLKGKDDILLQSDDVVRVFSVDEARAVLAAVEKFMTDRRASTEALYTPGSTSATSVHQLGAANLGDSGTTSGALVLQSAQSAGAGQTQGDLQALNSATAASIKAATTENSGLGTSMQQGAPGMQQGTPGAYNLPGNLQTETTAPGGYATNRAAVTPTQIAGQLYVDPVTLLNFLQDHTVTLDGAIRDSGLYVVGPDTELQSLMQAAGGLSTWANRNAIEVTSTAVDMSAGVARTNRITLSLNAPNGAGYILLPHDQVRVNDIHTVVGVGSVTVQGQVRNVGVYQITRGEHLSDLLARAGGLTDVAYPYGTVFLRRSAAEQEQDAYRREAKEIQNQLLLAMSRRDPQSKLSPDAFAALQSYITQIKNQKALGRVSIVADPAILAAHPNLDPLLEPGDVIYIPQRPYSVAVLGDVLQPGSVPFNPDMSASDYINRAGGYSQFADKSSVILVLPDGSARPLEHSWFHIGSDDIPPGSTIFVSRDISGLDLHQIIVDTTSIVSQLAVSAASLAVLSTQIK